MAQRYFTSSEANELLAEVRPLAESLVQHRQGMRQAAERRARLTARIAGNGGDLDPQEPGELDEQFQRESHAVTQAAERLERLGVQVKDLDRGLVDFPALHEGQEVLLCWQVGEDEVAYWHGVDEGFAGRKPLPLD
ncbi:MAG TPA: DUF2203 domain-containing protein [Gaiellaceae bacterium]|jgi:hypothetical protein|nr:DUF2203 domain-containing protein [Gaiellaceae bacterium]